MDDRNSDGESPTQGEIKAETTSKPQEGEKVIPPHCMKDYNPSQSINAFEKIRLFSDFDSGNLLKVERL